MSAAARVALITGSARRIGAAIARTLHAAGYDLALHARSASVDLDTLTAELETTRPGSTLTLHADLADVERLPELVAHTVARFGRLDALVNNASSFHPTAVGSTTSLLWDALFASNARAPFFLAQAAAPHWRHLRRVMGAVLQQSSQRRAVWDEHQALADAIAAGQEDHAAALIAQHSEQAGEHLAGQLTQVLQSQAGDTR